MSSTSACADAAAYRRPGHFVRVDGAGTWRLRGAVRAALACGGYYHILQSTGSIAWRAPFGRWDGLCAASGVCEIAGARRSCCSWACCRRAARAEGVDVVVTIKPIHSLVAQVMEGVGAPTLLVDGLVLAAQLLAEALAHPRHRRRRRLHPRVGAAGAVHRQNRSIAAGERASRHARRRSRHQAAEPEADRHLRAHIRHDHDAPDRADDSAKDSHIWLDPDNAKAIGRYVGDVLSERYPQHAAQFKANAERLSAADRCADDGARGDDAAAAGPAVRRLPRRLPVFRRSLRPRRSRLHHRQSRRAAERQAAHRAATEDPLPAGGVRVRRAAVPIAARRGGHRGHGRAGGHARSGGHEPRTRTAALSSR